MKETHSITNVNESNRSGTCSICGLVKVILRNSKSTSLNSKYKCSAVHRRGNLKFSYPYREHKKTYCEQCGFVAINKCQLDVDHIDGNSKNNDLSNLQTLCANCHRLKTFINKEGSYKKGLIVPTPIDKPDYIQD